MLFEVIYANPKAGKLKNNKASFSDGSTKTHVIEQQGNSSFKVRPEERVVISSYSTYASSKARCFYGVIYVYHPYSGQIIEIGYPDEAGSQKNNPVSANDRNFTIEYSEQPSVLTWR